VTLHFTTSQLSFRGRDDTTALNTDGGWLAAINTNWGQLVDTTFRVRFELQETGGATGSFVPQLQYQRNGGGYVNVTGSSTVVRATASGVVADAAATTNLLINGTGTFAAGAFDETDGLTGTHAVAASGHTEVEFAVQIRSADVALGDTINLRCLGKSNATTALDAYPQTPAITVSGPQTVAADPALETDAAGLTLFYSIPIDIAASTEAAQTVTVDTGGGGGSPQSFEIGIAPETDSAAVPVEHLLDVLAADETDIAVSPVVVLAIAVTFPVETDAASVLGVAVAVDPAAETDTAEPVTADTGGGGQSFTIGIALEVDTAAQPIEHVFTLLIAAEADSPQTVVFASGTAVGIALETDTAAATNEWAVQPEPADETDAAETFGLAADIAFAAETGAAQAVTLDQGGGGAQSQPADPALETDAAQTVTSQLANTLAVDVAGETDAAQALSTPGALGVTAETDTAQTLSAVLGVPVAAESSLAVDVGRALPSTLAGESDAAQAVTASLAFTQTLGVAAESDAAQTISTGGATNIAVDPALETDAALAVASAVALAAAPATETDAAQTVTPVGDTIVAVVAAAEADTAAALSVFAEGIMPIALETDVARTLVGFFVIPIDTATETNGVLAVGAFNQGEILFGVDARGSSSNGTDARGNTTPGRDARGRILVSVDYR
jgi:hypothetical protein